MIAAINDLPFQYQMPSLAEAVERLNSFIELCRQIEQGQMTNVDKLVIAREYDYSGPLAPGYVLKRIVQQINPPDKRRYLMSVLTKRDVVPECGGVTPFCLDGKQSLLCAYAKDQIVVSLNSAPVFGGPVLNGVCGAAPQAICNLSTEAHIGTHKVRLGIRCYYANSKKHKQDRENYYGKGKPASPMDLDDETAQRLLNCAVRMNNRLYAMRGGKIYAFMEERPCIYHGYIDDEAPEHVRRKLEDMRWD